MDKNKALRMVKRVKQKTEEEKRVKASFTLDKDVIFEFSVECERQGVAMSRIVEDGMSQWTKAMRS